MTKVRIDSPGVTVEIEADGTLDEVTDKALHAFREAGGWPQPRPGPAFGFHADRRWTPPAQPSGMNRSPGPYPIQGEESA